MNVRLGTCEVVDLYSGKAVRKVWYICASARCKNLTDERNTGRSSQEMHVIVRSGQGLFGGLGLVSS